MTEPLQIETTRFGTVSAAPEAVLTFASGLIGFEDLRRFVAVPHEPESPFVWLQSVERPETAFLLLPPEFVFPGYGPALPPDLPADGRLWVIVTLPPGRPHDMTANLLGPIVVDPATNQGRQVILENSERFTTRHRVFPDAAEAGRK